LSKNERQPTTVRRDWLSGDKGRGIQLRRRETDTQEQGATDLTTKSGKLVVGPKRNDQKNKNKDRTPKVVTTRSNNGQVRIPETFGLREVGTDTLKMLYGKEAIRTKQDEGKNLTTFEGLVFLEKVDENRAGKEMLPVREDLLAMGLKAIAPDENEIKSRRGIEEMYGSEGDTSIWDEYKNNPAANKMGLQAAVPVSCSWQPLREG
jgi:hypothetical protein